MMDSVTGSIKEELPAATSDSTAVVPIKLEPPEVFDEDATEQQWEVKELLQGLLPFLEVTVDPPTHFKTEQTNEGYDCPESVKIKEELPDAPADLAATPSITDPLDFDLHWTSVKSEDFKPLDSGLLTSSSTQLLHGERDLSIEGPLTHHGSRDPNSGPQKPEISRGEREWKGAALIGGNADHVAIHTRDEIFSAIPGCSTDPEYLDTSRDGDEVLRCSQSDVHFEGKKVIKTHIAAHVGAEKHFCKVCNKQFASSSHLVTHSRVHTGGKKFPCEVCGKRFRSNYSLVNHVRVHTGGKPFQCTVCNKQFSQSSNLLCHIRVHTGERPYRCEVCSKQFSQSSTLLNHSKTHSDYKPFKCELCNKHFSRSSTLITHSKTHTVDKPFQFNVINKQFSYFSHLTNNHKGFLVDPPFQCQVCKKHFSQSSALIEHSKTHEDETVPG